LTTKVVSLGLDRAALGLKVARHASVMTDPLDEPNGLVFGPGTASSTATIDTFTRSHGCLSIVLAT
jgi:hypothetical protein